MGRNPGILPADIFEIMEYESRPVWTASAMGEAGGVSRVTAKKRLEEMADAGDLERITIANATGYYLAGVVMRPMGENDIIKQSLRRHFTDKFVGVPTKPWETGTEKPAEPGERVQIRADGSPGHWTIISMRHYDNRRKELMYDEIHPGETSALISGEVYNKPTTAIEHSGYPPDYDLEGAIGAEIVGDEYPNILAKGRKNYLIFPVNDGKFIRDIEVEWVSPADEDADPLPTADYGDPETEGTLSRESFVPPTYADIVILEECEPTRAYIDQQPGGTYQVIPADAAGEELEDYTPTAEFKDEVRRKTAVDGNLRFDWGGV